MKYWPKLIHLLAKKLICEPFDMMKQFPKRISSFYCLQNFAVELQLETLSEFEMDLFRDALIRAGGANYGTGVRDLWVRTTA